MKYPIAITFCLIAAPVCAELPAYVERPAETVSVSHETYMMSDTALRALQKRLSNAVFVAFAHQPPGHSLARNGLNFDGSCVAVEPDAVQDIVRPTDRIEQEPPAAKPNTHSFFDRGLDRHTSPFAERETEQSRVVAGRQYFLTTADWITRSDSIEIDQYGQRVRARLEYRDDAWNVAVLSTPPRQGIEPVKVLDADKPIPGEVFLLLNPNSFYEHMTRHALGVTQTHRYGSVNMTARNGYPLFSSRGELVGLTVGPDVAGTSAAVVHPGILDRALHPQKYDKVTVEETELRRY